MHSCVYSDSCKENTFTDICIIQLHKKGIYTRYVYRMNQVKCNTFMRNKIFLGKQKGSLSFIEKTPCNTLCDSPCIRIVQVRINQLKL